MLLHGRAFNAPFLRERTGDISVGSFLQRAMAVGNRIRGAKAVINLCEQRLHFLAALAGALQEGVPTLMPSARAPDVVVALASDYPGAFLLHDDDTLASVETSWRGDFLVSRALRADQPSLIGFTSGSTGKPSAHRKYWSSLVASTALNAARVREVIPAEFAGRLPWIVGTVPPQHMYGMELTVLVPLLAGFGLHGARPLLPAEVAVALGEVPEPRVLVSTPTHLRAIISAGVDLPKTQVVISATAPLEPGLAIAAEAATGGRVVEMFGATETCILGSRQTARESRWNCYDGVRFAPADDGTLVDAPWFPAPQKLLDLIEQEPDGTFRLLGRSRDMIEVAGKRASLADLTKLLLSLDGVRDGVFIQLDSGEGLVRRLAALVVAPSLSAAGLRKQLQLTIDPVFSPRPVVFVDKLPRNAMGKLPRQELLAMLTDYEKSGRRN